MPNYGYFCPVCGKEEEVYLKSMSKVDEKDKEMVCCDKQMERPIYSPSSIKFCEKGAYIQNKDFCNEKDEYNFYKKKHKEKFGEKKE